MTDLTKFHLEAQEKRIDALEKRVAELVEETYRLKVKVAILEDDRDDTELIEGPT